MICSRNAAGEIFLALGIVDLEDDVCRNELLDVGERDVALVAVS